MIYCFRETLIEKLTFYLYVYTMTINIYTNSMVNCTRVQKMFQ